MDRHRRSPSYSPPQFLHQTRRRSPSFSPPRVYRGRSSQIEPPRNHRSPPRQFLKRSNSRSPSPRGQRKRDGSTSKDISHKRKTASPPGSKLQSFDFLADDAEARRTFFCKHCNVKLHDLVSMESHLKGRPHLMQQQRITDNEMRITKGHGVKARFPPPGIGKLQYEDRFWKREKAQKKLEPEQKRWLDESRLDKIKPKFQGDSYDQGQFSFREEEIHCDVCDVWVRSRDQMQQHKEGNNHKKMTEKVVRYHCNICLIDVTCRDSLESHKKGADHIRRAKQQAEKRKRMGQDELEGMQDSKSLEEYKKESYDLKRQLKILQNKVKQLQEDKRVCKDTHEDKDLNELRELKRNCIENHQRPMELRKHGKQEKNPRSVKSERRRSYHESDEDTKWGIKSEWMSSEGGRIFKKEEGWRDVKSERRSGEGGRGGFKSERREDGRSWNTANLSEATDEYIENEEDSEFKVEHEHGSDKEEYIENESDMKREKNADDEIITLE